MYKFENVGGTDKQVIENLILKKVNREELNPYVSSLFYKFVGSQNVKDVIRIIRENVNSFQGFYDLALFFMEIGYVLKSYEFIYKPEAAEGEKDTFDYYGEQLTFSQIIARVFGARKANDTAYVEKLNSFRKKYGAEAVIFAMKEAKELDKLSLRYIERILEKMKPPEDKERDKTEAKAVDWVLIRTQFDDETLKTYDNEEALSKDIDEILKRDMIKEEYWTDFKNALLNFYRKIKR